MTDGSHIEKTHMILVEILSDGDQQEQELLLIRSNAARDHLLSFNWCRKIEKLWFAGGFSHVAVFFAEIDSVQYDRQLWIVVGDLPPAHLVVDEIPDFKEALLTYAYHMRKWVAAVKAQRSTKRCMPVNVEPTLEHAKLLESRLDFIEKEYVPSLP
jgi:hypothetical protein